MGHGKRQREIRRIRKIKYIPGESMIFTDGLDKIKLTWYQRLWRYLVTFGRR